MQGWLKISKSNNSIYQQRRKINDYITRSERGM